VHRIITDVAVLEITADGLDVTERAPDVSPDDVTRATGTPVTFGLAAATV